MSTAHWSSQQITPETPIEFADRAEVRDAVLDECRVQERLQQFITEFSAARNITIEPSNGWVSGTSGRVLEVRITDLYAPSGGAFAVFRGTCDILGHNVRTLGEDLSNSSSIRVRTSVWAISDRQQPV